MKRIKKTVIIAAFCLLFCVFSGFAARAEDTENSSIPDFPKIEISQTAQEELNDLGVDPNNQNWYLDFDLSKVIKAAVKSIEDNYKQPLKLFLSVCSVVLIDAALLHKIKDNRFSAFITLCVSVGVFLPLFKVIEQTAAVLEELSNFIITFFPAFFGVAAASGRTVTAAVASPVIMGASAVFDKIICGVFLPFMGCYLAVSVCSGITVRLNISSVCENVKNTVLWVLGGLGTVFIGILSALSSAASGADNLSIRAGKYIAGSIPAVGSAISESLSFAISSAAAVKGSFGGIGIICLAAVLLPPLITLLLYKGALLLCCFVCESFSSASLKTFIKNISGAITIVIGALVFTGITFIISLAVLLGV